MALNLHLAKWEQAGADWQGLRSGCCVTSAAIPLELATAAFQPSPPFNTKATWACFSKMCSLLKA